MPGDARPSGPLLPPTPSLTDGIVDLTELREADVPAIVAACSDPETRRWLLMETPYTPEIAQERLVRWRGRAERGEELNLAIRLSGAEELVGVIGADFSQCRAGESDIGYWVTASARGRGVARRAIALLEGHVFATWGPRRIKLLIQPANVASRAAAEGAGATSEGIRLRGLRRRDGSVVDAAVYALLPDG
jgi:[ribosomal protein S5]-alanine N-acetyltransferase